MKKNILMLLLLSTCTVYAQPYQSIFGTNSTSWNVFKVICDGGFTDSMFVAKDTVVNDLVYKILKIHDYTYGLVRESDDKSQVFFKECTYSWGTCECSTSENTIMNLNLSLKDTLVVNEKLKIVVDSVFIEEGRKHIRFNYKTPIFTEKNLEFIEGIGSNCGFFTLPYFGKNIGCSSPYRPLLCAYKDGEQIYTNNSLFFLGECHYEMVGINEKVRNIKHSLFPNPIQNTSVLKFENTNQQGIELHISDISGRRIESQWTHGDSFTISASNKESGLYLYHLVSKGQILLNDKLVIVK